MKIIKSKKDNSKDKNRIKRIIFLKTREEAKVKTIHNLFPLLFFQIYPSGYNSSKFSLSNFQGADYLYKEKFINNKSQY